MAKTANVYARIEPDVKEQAEEILAQLGIPASNAINMFYKQIILKQGIPFDVVIPSADNELIDSLQKSIDEMENGQLKSSKDVFASLHQRYQ